jgi:hypothetical protein
MMNLLCGRLAEASSRKGGTRDLRHHLIVFCSDTTNEIVFGLYLLQRVCGREKRKLESNDKAIPLAELEPKTKNKLHAAAHQQLPKTAPNVPVVRGELKD